LLLFTLEMNRGWLVLAGVGLISLLAFGVTLEAINDPAQLSAIPFTPWDFLTYSIIALAILTLIHVVRKRNPRKALVRKWTSRLAQQGARIRTSLCLASDGSALIDTTLSKGADYLSFLQKRDGGCWMTKHSICGGPDRDLENSHA
jgi:hypothetical protein